MTSFGECVSLSGEVSQAGLDAVQALFVSAGGECEGGVGVSECGTGCVCGGGCLLADFFDGVGRVAVAVHSQPPHERCAVHKRVRALLHYGRADDVFVELDGVGVFPLRQFEERLVPGEVDLEGGAAVVALEPVAEEVAAVNCVAFFEIYMGDGVGGVAAGRTCGKGALGEG